MLSYTSGEPSEARASERRQRTHMRQPSAARHQRSGSRALSHSRTASLANGPTGASERLVQEYWTRTPEYNVRSAIIRLNKTVKSDSIFAGRVDATTGHVLLISESAAYVFPYRTGAVAHAEPPTAAFPLPRDEPYGNGSGSAFHVQSAPLACLTAPNAGSQSPGLVVVMPISGKATYWTSIDAASGVLMPQNCTEARIGLAANEVITCMENVEPAGLVVSTSSGKLIHVGLRDHFSRPAISHSVMNIFPGASGFFDSITSTFKGATFRRDICSIRAGRAVSRSDRQVLTISKRGVVGHWVLSRTATPRVISETDISERVAVSIAEQLEQMQLTEVKPGSIQFLDCCSCGLRDDELDYAVVSGSFESHMARRYFVSLLQMQPNASGVSAINTHVIRWYSRPASSSAQDACSLHWTIKGSFIVAVLSDAVIMLQSPSTANGNWIYEGMFGLNSKRGVSILASGPESYISHLQSILLVSREAGVLRLAFDAEKLDGEKTLGDILQERAREFVMYRSDLSPLTFPLLPEMTCDTGTISKALLKVCFELLRGTGPVFDSRHFVSMNELLDFRSQSLCDLCELYVALYKLFDAQTRLQLLVSGEKAYATLKCWQSLNFELAASDIKSTSVIIQSVKSFAEESMRQDENYNGSGKDSVRLWFQHGAAAIGELISRAHATALDMLSQLSNNRSDEASILRAISESNEVVLCILGSAQTFREEKAAKFGLNKAQIFQQNFNLWTCTVDILRSLKDQHELTRKVLTQLRNGSLAAGSAGASAAIDSFTNTLSEQLTSLSLIACTAFEERIEWCNAQFDRGLRDEASDLKDRYPSLRQSWIFSVAQNGHVHEAFQMAERFSDFSTLVVLIFEERKTTHDSELFHSRIKVLFDRFGKNFAYELYHYMIHNGYTKELLTEFTEQKLTLKSYFADNPRPNLSWIFDLNTSEVASAGATLYKLANEPNSGTEKAIVSLSIAKLCTIAEAPGMVANPHNTTRITSIDADLAVLNMQKQLRASLAASLNLGNVPGDAAISSAFRLWVNASSSSKSASSFIVKKHLRTLLLEQRMADYDFVDLLTLKSHTADIESRLDFVKALQIIMYSEDTSEDVYALDSQSRNFSQKLVFRRLYQSDDWLSITDTASKSDEDVTNAVRETILFTTIRTSLQEGIFTSLPMSPATAAAADPSEFESAVSRHYMANTKAEQKLILDMLHAECATLDTLMKSHDLEKWVNMVFSSAQSSLDEEMASFTT